MLEYLVVHSNLAQLMATCSTLMRQGYEPVGGVSWDGNEYIQAMVRYEAVKVNDVPSNYYGGYEDLDVKESNLSKEQ